MPAAISPGAIAAFQSTVRDCPRLTRRARNALAIALLADGQLEEAVAACDEALRIAPDSAVTHHTRGQALQARAKDSEASAAYRRAIEIEPAFSDVHHSLGHAFVQEGEVDGAIAAPSGAPSG